MSRVESAVPRSARWIAPLAAVVVLCGAGAAVAMATSTTVTTHQTKRGKVLAAANGHSLYMFSADRSGKSNCNSTCANTWLPLVASGRPVADVKSGVNAKLLGTIKRASHTSQVTYNGHPLYLFSKDKSAGQINGEGAEGFGGHWYLVSTAGKEVQPMSGTPVCNPLCQGY